MAYETNTVKIARIVSGTERILCPAQRTCHSIRTRIRPTLKYILSFWPCVSVCVPIADVDFFGYVDIHHCKWFCMRLDLDTSAFIKNTTSDFQGDRFRQNYGFTHPCTISLQTIYSVVCQISVRRCFTLGGQLEPN